MGHFRKNIVSILLSEKCNLACRYCYNNEIRKSRTKLRSISTAFAERGIDDFFANSNSRALRFFGAGEATIEFDKMREIWTYGFRKAGNELYTELQTNGFFYEEICHWVIDHIDMIWISSDGPSYIQNFHRPKLGGGQSAPIVEKISWR